MMTMKQSFLASLGLTTSLVACGAAKGPESVQCDGRARTQIDCGSEVKYDGIRTGAGGSVLNIASANGKYEEVALRRINENVEKYVTVQVKLCRDYNSCAVDDAG